MKIRGGHLITDSLARRLWATLPAPPAPPPKPETVVHGPKVRAARPQRLTKQPDAMLLEIRRLHETEGLGATAIARQFNLKPWRVDQILSYYTRAHLVPERRLQPYWPE